MNNSQSGNNELLSVIDLWNKLLVSSPIVPLPKEFDSHPQIVNLYENMLAIRSVLDAFSKGDFSVKISLKGALGGMLKTLQANLCHLSWQVQMVAKGDFTQRVEFMGEFSEAFNSMVIQMDVSLKELRGQEEKLHKITENLKNEIAVRVKAEEALKKSYKHYQGLALTDPLTNLSNRRYFYELAKTELKRMQRNGGEAIIGMLDVDYFKQFNDTYGHVAGDTCLKIVASMIRKCIREVDVAARYGGEEFVFILPQTGINAGLIVAERVRREIANTSIAVGNMTTNVTVSIGITEVKAEQTHNIKLDHLLSQCIQNADFALYHAKRNGRNHVANYADLEKNGK